MFGRLSPETRPTTFFGRVNELAEIGARLGNPECCLLTLIGPGGIGKTRLALEAASSQRDDYPDGVHFVPLQPLTSSEFIVPAIADALNFQFFSGIEPQAQLLNYLSSQSLLLILDNLEQLLDGVELISEILAAAPNVKVLATSRERLNLLEEWVFDVGGLLFPANDAEIDIETYSAVMLFAQNARRVRPGFGLNEEQAAIVHICRFLEGMPLGIELAASWTRTLSCHEIARQLERGLDILTTSARNMPERHRNMRAVLDHSWVLLSANEQAVFARLSIFRGGFTLAAAESVAGATLALLAALVDKSWLRYDFHTERYDIHELLRQYGAEQLDNSNEVSDQSCDCHSSYYAAFIERQEPVMKGSGQKAALQAIENDLDNIRAAWNWAVEHHYETELYQMCDVLWKFYDTGSRFHEGEQLFARAAAIIRTGISAANESRLLGRLLSYQGALLHSLARYVQAMDCLQESLAILRRHDARAEMAFCLLQMGQTARILPKRLPEASEYIKTGLALYQEMNDTFGIAEGFLWSSIVLLGEGELSGSRQACLESVARYRQLGNPWGLAKSLQIMSSIELRSGNYSQAQSLLEESKTLFQELGIVWGIALTMEKMGLAALDRGDYTGAYRWLLRALTLEMQCRLEDYILNTLFVCAKALYAQGYVQRAVEIIVLVDRQFGNLGIDHQWLDDYLDSLRAKVPSRHFAEAVERGQVLDLQVTVRDVMADFARQIAEDEQPSPVGLVESNPESLTARELEVLSLVAVGLSNREIADQLVLALGTVKWYISDIFSKLGVSSRTQAVARARVLNLLP